MHELAVAQALVEQVDAVIHQNRAQRATLIRVRIGPLAGVVPDLLATAFPLAAAGSRMEHAELEFAHAPIRVRCQTCGLDSEAAMNRLICGACGDWHTRIISGDELLLESVELETTPVLSPES
ncbi:hydrogenase maturation nickel metallochaperone HypA [Thiobacillus sp. 65-1402]|uniref:hydrogenase maturation nickel metallochaperone HypA/HybF n=1 Tax=Thiobacillus sp. 65-1402 TaxID=1895861 RepID=UPI00086F4757|nr:hydrogenase maturation nickel metallochaperone HypA [Thiobacillus sp. 65-1402]ODU01693.1 MAG: hydrogenase nickel incorporation protein HypA [Thiobacillus sp. SCN 63-1177]OJW94570.1 MAG: hydrogenase nickel incorporation protein HypA [Thiobacillus sp. 65-1402]